MAFEGNDINEGFDDVVLNSGVLMRAISEDFYEPVNRSFGPSRQVSYLADFVCSDLSRETIAEGASWGSWIAASAVGLPPKTGQASPVTMWIHP